MIEERGDERAKSGRIPSLLRSHDRGERRGERREARREERAGAIRVCELLMKLGCEG
jgi:hypothetical protein